LLGQETLTKTLLPRKQPDIKQELQVKSRILAIVTVTVVSLLVTALFVYSQISELQNQIGALEAQNGEVQDQLSELQNQLREQQLQNREQQDRLTDFTYELAKARHLRVEITDYSKVGGGPIVGLTFIIGIYVNVQNNDIIPVSGLTITSKLIDNDTGVQIGDVGVTKTGRLNAGESGNFSVPVLYSINSLSRIHPADVVIVLMAGNVVLD
jgi:cell division protein FtsL